MSTVTPVPTPGSSLRRGLVIARQAIFDPQLRVDGYELLYREPGSAAYTGAAADGPTDTAAVLVDGLIGVGLDRMTAGHDAWVNVSEELLVSGYLEALPSDRLVIEVLETVEDTAEVRDAVERLRTFGFRVALDDVVGDDPRLSMLPLVDAVKIDMALTTPQDRAGLTALARRHGVKVLFEKVETLRQRDQTFALGADWLQGYFFARPDLVVSGRARKLGPSHLRVLDVLAQRELDVADVETAIRSDVELAERFLRFVNSSGFGWRRRIESLRHGLILIGTRDLRHWLSLVLLSAVASDKPSALLEMASVRSRFAESLAPLVRLPDRRLDLFSLGMFSLFDVFLDVPMEQALDGLPVAPDVRDALLGEPNDLRRVLDLVVACERGDWTTLDDDLAGLGIDAATAIGPYLDAVAWASELSGALA